MCVFRHRHGPQPTATARMQTGLQRGVVLQSGRVWVIVAIELKPRTGVVRFLPPHHSGPLSFLSFAPRFRKDPARWPSEVFTSTASIPRTGSRFLLASGLLSPT